MKMRIKSDHGSSTSDSNECMYTVMLLTPSHGSIIFKISSLILMFQVVQMILCRRKLRS